MLKLFFLCSSLFPFSFLFSSIFNSSLLSYLLLLVPSFSSSFQFSIANYFYLLSPFAQVIFRCLLLFLFLHINPIFQPSYWLTLLHPFSFPFLTYHFLLFIYSTSSQLFSSVSIYFPLPWRFPNFSTLPLVSHLSFVPSLHHSLVSFRFFNYFVFFSVIFLKFPCIFTFSSIFSTLPLVSPFPFVPPPRPHVLPLG